MERRPRPAVNETWDQPDYGYGSAQRPPRFRHEPPSCPPSRAGPHGEAPPGVFYPDGGAPGTGPWESRPPYEAGRTACSPLDGSEQRFPHRDVTQHGYREPQEYGGPQFRPQRPDVFPYGGARPGVPHHGPLQPAAFPPRLPPCNLQRAGDLPGLQSPIVQSDPSVPSLPQHRAPEPPQGVMQRTPEVGIQGRPLPMIPARSEEYVSDHRREGQRLYSHEDLQQSGARLHGGPQHRAGERQESMYSEGPLPRSGHPDAYQPGFFHLGGPDPASSQYFGGRQPAGFQHELPHNRSNLPHTYQNEGCHPGMSGIYNVETPQVPDTYNYRAPSPGLQQFSAQPQPATQHSHYNVPPIHGNIPNPSYALPPPVGPGLSGSAEESDLEVPRLQREPHHSHHLLNLHQDRRQGLDPLMASGGRHFEDDARFLQHEVPDGRRDPCLVLQRGVPFVSQPTPHMEDNSMHLDRHTDKDIFVQWLSSFLACRRKKPPAKPDAVPAVSIAEARGLIYGALRLVSQLNSLCQSLESGDKAGEPWTGDYEKAANIRGDLEKRLKELEKPGYIQGVKRKLERVCKKRLRWQRRRQSAEEEGKLAAERSAEKEASIDLWRLKCIQVVEEKKRERELKATADHVLCEVRKKQNDVKKMLDVLKSLEKLRKLRKEAAGRKGVFPPPSADETFSNHIKRLRTLVHKRSALYDAEEMTLRVILEGEQEEERQRESDKRQKKEKEKTLQKQRELDSILFGDADPLPSLHPLQPFRHYYLQAEHSVVSLVQIRHEWDQFLVPPDHPDGSSIPRGWVVPTLPSNDTWATALKQSD
ncbi:programmed cell death protein 7 [Bufo gargarizans]|uniref:programmed cell death protein 7 n=1 Tax=Bufo gargarizans TaxID=30331 RepID=UPI001CF5A685|nr:programmed cell death protein 7 [Bufo gargarizans]